MAKTTTRNRPTMHRSRRIGFRSEAAVANTDDLPVLKAQQIKAGDVLLCVADKPDRLTLRIRKQIGPYTHAAISLGRGRIADAGEDGVTTSPLKELIAWSSRIAVLKGWIWSPTALKQFRKFVRWAVTQQSVFNFEGMRRAIAAREEHLGNIMNLIRDDSVPEPKSRKSTSPTYFCSEFVVACFADAGLIKGKAKVVFKPDTYTPWMLAQDSIFGEFRGYLLKQGRNVPSEDPLRHLLI